MTNEVELWEHFLHLFSKYWSYYCAHALEIASEEFTKKQELVPLTQMCDIIENASYVPDMLIIVSKILNFTKIL